VPRPNCCARRELSVGGDRLAVPGGRVRDPAAGREHCAEIAHRFGEPAVDIDRAAVAGLCLVEAALPLQQNAEVVVAGRELRVDTQRPAQKIDRRIIVVPRVPHPAEQKPRDRPLRRAVDKATQHRFRLVERICVEQALCLGLGGVERRWIGRFSPVAPEARRLPVL
jgi:hypothetical protein